MAQPEATPSNFFQEFRELMAPPPHAEKAYQVLTTISKAAEMAILLVTGGALGINVLTGILGHPILDSRTVLYGAGYLMLGPLAFFGNKGLDDHVEQRESRKQIS